MCIVLTEFQLSEDFNIQTFHLEFIHMSWLGFYQSQTYLVTVIYKLY
jgi:hypothetical protein